MEKKQNRPIAALYVDLIYLQHYTDIPLMPRRSAASLLKGDHPVHDLHPLEPFDESGRAELAALVERFRGHDSVPFSSVRAFVHDYFATRGSADSPAPADGDERSVMVESKESAILATMERAVDLLQPASVTKRGVIIAAIATNPPSRACALDLSHLRRKDTRTVMNCASRVRRLEGVTSSAVHLYVYFGGRNNVKASRSVWMISNTRDIAAAFTRATAGDDDAENLHKVRRLMRHIIPKVAATAVDGPAPQETILRERATGVAAFASASARPGDEERERVAALMHDFLARGDVDPRVFECARRKSATIAHSLFTKMMADIKHDLATTRGPPAPGRIPKKTLAAFMKHVSAFLKDTGLTFDELCAACPQLREMNATFNAWSMRAERASAAVERAFFCANCGRTNGTEGKELKKCAGCQLVFYCSRTCQKADWRAGHRETCAGREAA